MKKILHNYTKIYIKNNTMQYIVLKNLSFFIICIFIYKIYEFTVKDPFGPGSSIACQ